MAESALSITASATRRSALDAPPDLDHVFAHFLDPVYRFLYSRVGNRQDAEDLTSEVFLKATRQLDPARPTASIGQWLFVVARTVLADHWRRYYRTGRPLPLDDAVAAALPEADPAPGGSETSAETVQAILERLPDRPRRVLELRFLAGYSVDETAEALGLTAGNVKVIQHRALARAVELMEGIR